MLGRGGERSRKRNFGFRISEFGFATQPPYVQIGIERGAGQPGIRISTAQARVTGPGPSIASRADKSEIRNPKFEIPGRAVVVGSRHEVGVPV